MKSVIKKTKKSNGKTQLLLNNKVFHIIILLIIIILDVFFIKKIFMYRKEINYYGGHVDEVTKKMSKEIKNYFSSDEDTKEIKGMAAKKIEICLKQSEDVNNMSESIKNKITEIKNYFNTSNNYIAFKYEDIYSGFTLAYNENQAIFAASTIKAPVDIYIYEQASLDKIDLSKQLTYTSNYYNEGTGVLKNRSFNVNYPIRELISYSIMYSDNAAHNMLMNHVGREKILKFWKDKGTEVIFTSNNNWGSINAHDANIYMKELYNFYNNNDEYGNELMNYFLNTTWKPIKSLDNKYKTANKSGWTGSNFHDVAIVFADNPYIISIMSNTGQSNYTNFFNKASILFGELHEEYWKYKTSQCMQINQY